jgi:hypothetical protein
LRFDALHGGAGFARDQRYAIVGGDVVQRIERSARAQATEAARGGSPHERLIVVQRDFQLGATLEITAPSEHRSRTRAHVGALAFFQHAHQHDVAFRAHRPLDTSDENCRHRGDPQRET